VTLVARRAVIGAGGPAGVGVRGSGQGDGAPSGRHRASLNVVGVGRCRWLAL